MIERAWKKKKQLCISEDDIATVLERYSVTTVLALLKEVSRYPDAKLDWKELVKNTQTGISNAREYQMLWRHLAYRQTLLDKLEDGAEPLDDDSDLEYEFAAFPPVSHEATAEAAACVRVMMESGLSDSGHSSCSMVEAPLTLNVPNGHSSRSSENSKTHCSMQGINITVPVCVQKQPVPGGTSNEGLDTNGTNGNMPRRKRKPWTEAEDVELIAAVQKCGEGNWANILKSDFKGDRTASQLSQRWAIIRKKNVNVNVGGRNPSPAPQLSEALLATRNAVNLALKQPAKNITSPCSVDGTGLNGAPSNSACLPNVEVSSLAQAVRQSEQGLKATFSNSVHPPNAEVGSGVQGAHQSQQGPIPSKSAPMGALGLSAKSRVIAKKPITKSVYSSDSMVKATAVAAGARIATRSVADSVIKAAKNVHIMPSGGGSLMKSAMSSGATTHLAGHPNVHYICTGLAATSHPTYHSVTPSVPRPTRPSPPASQLTSSIAATSPNMISKQTNAISSSLSVEHPVNQHAKSGKEIKVSEMDNVPKEQVQEDRACVAGDVPGNQVVEDKPCLPDSAAGLKEETIVDDPSNLKTTDSDVGAVVGKKAEVSQDANQNSDKAEVSQGPRQKKNNDKESHDANQKNKTEVGQDADEKNNKAEESQNACHDANQKNKTEVGEDANEKNNKAEESQNACQNSNKADESQDANPKNNKAKESHEANQKNNKAEDHNQAANHSNEIGGCQINATVGGGSVNGNCKNELLPPSAADGASEKPEIIK